mgnify:CR=1 FL=1
MKQLPMLVLVLTAVGVSIPVYAVQPCRGGQIGLATRPYDDQGDGLMQKYPQLRAAHRLLAGNNAWLSKAQLSADTHEFIAGDGTRIEVVWFCAPHDCGDNRFYGAWVPATGAYAGVVYKLGSWVALGSADANQRAALECTAEAEGRRINEVRREIERSTDGMRAPWEEGR